MSTGTFLDVVTILSGVLMLGVAFIILYNKCPDIIEEFRSIIGRPETPTAAQRRGAIAKVLQEIEDAKQVHTQSTPAPEADEIKHTVTVDSPESCEQSIECKITDNGTTDADDYVAKFMARRNSPAPAPSPFNKSEADTCSVYVESCNTSAIEPMSRYVPSPVSTTTKDILNMTPNQNLNMTPNGNEDMDGLSMDYSLDTAENKESFSSFARTNYSMNNSMNNSMMESPTTCAGTSTYPFSFLSKYNNITIGTNDLPKKSIESESEMASVSSEDDKVIASSNSDEENGDDDDEESTMAGNQLEDSYETYETNLTEEVVATTRAKTPSAATRYRTETIIPVASDHLKIISIGSKSSFESSNYSGGPTTIASNNSGGPTTIASNHSDVARMEESSFLPASRDSFSPLVRRNVTFSSELLDDSSRDPIPSARRKPKISIVTSKRLLNLEEEDDLDSDQEILDIEKEITPYTVSTAGMWSPSGSLSPQACDQDMESVSTFGYSLPSDESPYERKARELSPVEQDVHVCNSRSCTACRNQAFNTPKFVPTTKPSTGESYRLPRPLPSRWWDYQQSNYGQLKQYVSSVLLRGGQARDVEDEDHPFDEA